MEFIYALALYLTAFICYVSLGASGMIKGDDEIRERRLKEKLAELKKLVSEFEELDEKLANLERTVRGHRGD